ncbi:hypothetical protein [Streptomyces sp. NRRL S-1868]|uniref:hypothetical protein n=1 Tax=Streptomyces sp. NRRL S-1868 TaxID=1463892 RepID=UPI0004C8FA4F|nr:hypothetical protein [Streptomyces sp. NRRL S-1868]
MDQSEATFLEAGIAGEIAANAIAVLTTTEPRTPVEDAESALYHPAVLRLIGDFYLSRRVAGETEETAVATLVVAVCRSYRSGQLTDADN